MTNVTRNKKCSKYTKMINQQDNKKIKINKSLSFIVTCFYINSLIVALLSSTLSILFLKSSIIKYFALILTIFVFNKYYSFKNIYPSIYVPYY